MQDVRSGCAVVGSCEATRWFARRPSGFYQGRCHEAGHVGRFQWRCRLHVAGAGICRDHIPGHPERCGASRVADRAFQRWAGGVNQGVKLGDIVAVGAGENYRERDALRFGNEVMF